MGGGWGGGPKYLIYLQAFMVSIDLHTCLVSNFSHTEHVSNKRVGANFT